MYQLRILAGASRDLAKLDTPVGRRIVKRLGWLAEHLDEIPLEGLKGDFVGMFKLRVGDFRAVYEVLASERTIVVHVIGHRREIYRKG